MLFLLFALFIIFAIVKGFFKFVFPILILLFLAHLIFSSFLLLFSPHFWGFLLAIAFIVWLIKASRGGHRRYY